MTRVGVPVSVSGHTAWMRDEGALACLHPGGGPHSLLPSLHSPGSSSEGLWRTAWVLSA